MILSVPALRQIFQYVLIVAMVTSSGFTQTNQTPLLPILAHLATPMDTRKLSAGKEFLASLDKPWSGLDCSMKTGATLYGHIVAIEPQATGKGLSLKVAFDRADCNGRHAAAFRVLLAGLVVIPERVDFDAMQGQVGLFDMAPVAAGGGRSGTSSLAGGSRGGGGSSASGASPSLTAQGTTQHPGLQMIQPKVGSAEFEQATAGIRIDEVRGASHLTLHTFPAEALSQILSRKQSFQLGLRTEFVLLALTQANPEVAGLQPRTPETGVSLPPIKPAPQPVILVDQTEVCASGCNVVSDTAPDSGAITANTSAHPVAAVSLARLGYKPRKLGLGSAFDHDTTVTFLSAHQLLLTFDLHHLRERTGEAWHSGARRLARGVLINTQTHTIERVVDWQVEGTGAYLWQTGNGHILLHESGALHLLGPGLRREASFPVHGELLWVTSSPSGNRVAFGELNERHDKMTHTKIEEESGKKPEEDVEMTLIDTTGKALMHATGSSALRAPALTDDGEAVSRKKGVNRWQIIERSPDGTILRTLTELNSHCAPVVEVPAPNIISVEGCAVGNQHWYRVIRRDGHTLLKEAPSPDEIEQNAAYAGGGAMAVGTVRLKAPLGLGQMILQEQLDHERIEVHRLTDGKPMLAVVTMDFPTSHKAYALAPDDGELAVMGRSEIHFYRVDPARR